MTRSLRRGGLVALHMALCAPVLLHAQEIGLGVGGGTSEFSEFGSPISVAAHVRAPVGVLRLIGAYRLSWQGDRTPGTICDHYWPTFTNCTEEGIRLDHRLEQLEIGIGLGHEVAEDVELTVFVAAVRSSLRASSAGAESGRSTGNFYPDQAEWGRALGAGASWMAFMDGRAGVFGRVRHETLDLGECPTDVGAPFCRARSIATIEIGAVVRP